MSKQLGFYFNASACTGCKACQVACKDKNNNPLGINFRKVYQYSGGSWQPHSAMKGLMVPSNVFTYSMSVACMHCASPICVEVCPSGAMTKSSDGIVSVNADYCLGCRLCQQACPYGAPQFNPAKGVMTKCNLCADLIGQGEPPACVAICPMRALEVGELADLQAKYGTVNAIEPLPVATLTTPSIVITPHRHAQASGQGTGRVKVEV
jgi:anaerobic dimethyl sulfoxide reductase subunit B